VTSYFTVRKFRPKLIHKIDPRPFAVRAAIGRELFNIIMNELRVHLSADGGLIVGGQVVSVAGDSITLSTAPANRASCPGEITFKYIFLI
jgi:hypothetical protein